MMVEFALGTVQSLQIAEDVFSSHPQFSHLRQQALRSCVQAFCQWAAEYHQPGFLIHEGKNENGTTIFEKDISKLLR